MKILAHRGIWTKHEERNSQSAIRRAFDGRFGVETDVRDCLGELVISHDLPTGTELTLDVMLRDYVQFGCGEVLALNIKSDGIVYKIQERLRYYGISNYFCFDMSVPDTLSYIDCEVVIAARLSEYECESLLTNAASYLWLDSFTSDTYILSSFHSWERWLNDNKKICIVSSELHGREHGALWAALSELPRDILTHPGLLLCTDYPVEARGLFS